MPKRRKKTNKQVPAKGRLRDMADALWSLAIRADWGHTCAVCGKGKTEAHHLIPRQNEATRYDLGNGIALCAHHHQFDPEMSPHQNAVGWLNWMKHNAVIHMAFYAEAMATGSYREFTGTKNAAYYIGVIQGLREYVDDAEFERVCGIRFTRYLDSI